MMKRFAGFLYAHRKIFAFLLAAIVALSAAAFACGLQNGGYDSDIIKYLGEDSESITGLAFLNANFGVKGDIMLAVEGEDNDIELREAVGEIEQYSGVSELVWYGTLEVTDKVFAEFFDFFALFGIENTEIYDGNSLKEYLKRPTDTGEYGYVILILTEFSPSSDEAFSLLHDIEERLSDRDCASAGMTATARDIMQGTMDEVPLYLMLCLGSMLIILFLASDSYIEPLFLLATIVTAVIIGAGTNIIFGSVSILGLAFSAMLQLTVTTDFALIVNSFCKKNIYTADGRASAYAAVCGAAVTSCGFAALFAMRFGLGEDIAKVDIKAVIVSLAAALTVLPLMYALFGKAVQKTTFRKPLDISFNKTAKAVVKYRWVILAAAVPLIILSCFSIKNIRCSYFEIFENEKTEVQMEEMSSELRNLLIVAVPVTTKGESGQKAYITELEALESVDRVIGVFSAVNLDGETVEWMLENTSFAEDIPYVSSMFGKSAEGKWYTLYSIVIRGSAESPQATADYIKIKEISEKYFDTSYRFGLMSGVSDMKAVAPADINNILYILAGVLPLLAVLLLFSLKRGLAVAVLALASVTLNIAFEAATSRDTNFIVYLLIGSVQLGSTLNSGMLIACRYGEFRKQRLSTRDSAVRALSSCLLVMLVSLAVVTACALCIYLVSDNLIIKDLAKMLARGNAIGFGLMSTVLPAILSFRWWERRNVVGDR